MAVSLPVLTIPWRCKILNNMKIQKLNLSTAGYSDPGFLKKTNSVYVSMKNNPAFPKTVPPLADFKAAVDAFGTSLFDAAGGDRIAVAAKNEKRAELEALYVQLGRYVMYAAEGNVAIMISSGFTLGKDREPSHLQKPGAVTLTNGVTSGDLESMIATVKGCKIYLHQISDSEPTENTVWESRTCSRSRYTFKGLVPGKKFWVRIAATGSGQQIAYSPVASQFVQ